MMPMAMLAPPSIADLRRMAMAVSFELSFLLLNNIMAAAATTTTTNDGFFLQSKLPPTSLTQECEIKRQRDQKRRNNPTCKEK